MFKLRLNSWNNDSNELKLRIYSQSNPGKIDMQTHTAQVLETLHGKDGKDYVLTETDRTEIAQLAADMVDVQIPDVPEGAATEDWVKDYAQPKGEYLTQSDLQSATDNVLAQAKASGEFDGKDGADGKDGYTPVKGKDYFDGIDGKDGVDGKTPVKGVDYFDGVNGKDGRDGQDGKDGVGIKTVVRTAGNGSAGTTDTYTITMTNGSTATFSVYNGANGQDGKDGADGSDGKDGADGQRGTGAYKVTTAPSSYTTAVGGFTPTYRISKSTVLTQGKISEVLVGDVLIYSYYTYAVGYVDSSYVYLAARTSIRGSTGAAGSAGADGYTPQKGVDYFTEADKEEIIQEVITALGTPVFGRVDSENNIILTGELADGTYTLKYEDDKGELLDIGTINLIPYINQIPISTDTDGSIYNGTGYKTASRCNSSGAVVAIANPSAEKPPFVTGFIPCKVGDVIRLKNCYMHAHGGDSTSILGILYGGDGAFGVRSGMYNASKSKIAVTSWGYIFTDTDIDKITYTNPGGSDFKLTEFTIKYANTAYIRLTLAVEDGYTPADAIVTVNEEID